MTWRVGVDIGGTFTDFALLEPGEGRLFVHKQLTTPDNPARSVLSGLPILLSRAGLVPSAVSAVVHGTTLVTNALIERRGARTGMLVTAGFADVLDIARERRYDMYDLSITYPPPLIPRSLRFEVDERIDSRGIVVKALDPDQVQDATARLAAQGLESVAICLLNSPVNTAHEAQAAELIRSAFPNLYVCTSAEVFPFLREYERWNTACMNAYTGPLFDRYVATLEAGLSELGFSAPLFIMSSSGGMATPELARRFPIRMLESGPAAGVLQTVELGKAMRAAQLLAFDMGGTTAKGALVRAGQVLKRHEMEVARIHEFRAGSGLPVRIPVIDLIEIGSGGGSVARVDDRGALAVGPSSAGAVPGPVCYDRGGQLPTLTDANLILGYLDPSHFLGGAMSLNREASEQAIEKHLSLPLDVGVLRAAWGIHEAVNEDVARAFRNHASERGFDYRSCVMVAFGGSGPAHACRVARKLRVPTVIFPAGAGVMSAIGLLAAPLAFEVFRAERIALTRLSAVHFTACFDALLQQARAALGRGPEDDETERVTRQLDMRYQRQGHDIEVDLPEGTGPDRLRVLFESAYERVFGQSFSGQDIEITNWKLSLSLERSVYGQPFRLHRVSRGRALKTSRAAWNPDEKTLCQWPVYDREALRSGQEITGPAIIEEAEAACVVGPGDHLRVDARGNLVVSIALSQVSA
ncbi:MAG: hydantoinase/oxoprolinase family protein [Betaproteobacteria bacterium]|nr:hydantoinase/oxoprolinase family protein [Betaproteobacteria bacterium]